jgi:DHA3 family macrolide efflux protein-like MFS transporter
MDHTETRGMTRFLVVWAGQVVSMLGSNLTGFALGVWVYQQTGSATRFAFIALVTTLPAVLLSPLAGALIDRVNRRSAMILSDSGAGAATLILALLLWRGDLRLWEIYLLLGVNATFAALQWPAFSAATTLLVPKRHLGRASGMVQMGEGAATILAPLLAGALVVAFGIQSVVLIDFGTFVFALITLLAVRIPSPPVSAEGVKGRGALWREALSGWSFIRQRPGLLALLLLFATLGVSLGMVQVLLAPLVLSFASAAVYGRVASAAGLGMLAGSLLVSVWGGPRRRISGILGFLLVKGGILILAGLRPSALLIGTAAFLFLFIDPILYACSQALWQSKVPPDLQGRVFAMRKMVGWSTLPLAFLCAGPLADRVFEPLLAVGGPLAGSVGRFLGVGKGRGIGLLLIVLGCFVLLTVVAASRSSRLRRVEQELPDALPEEAIPSADPLAVNAAG